jgi:hypothetical protein
MPTMTRNDVLKQRNIWHTIAALPPRKADDVRVKSVPTKADLRTKAARDAIYDLQEKRRIEGEFAL